MFNPSLQEVRFFWIEAWAKSWSNQPLSDLERKAVSIIWQHPEHQTILHRGKELLLAGRSDALSEFGGAADISPNPFLHFSLHLALQEQITIDQPPGIALFFQKLMRVHDTHHTQHLMMDCLTMALQQAQQTGTGLDANFYLGRIQEIVSTD